MTPSVSTPPEKKSNLMAFGEGISAEFFARNGLVAAWAEPSVAKAAAKSAAFGAVLLAEVPLLAAGAHVDAAGLYPPRRRQLQGGWGVLVAQAVAALTARVGAPPTAACRDKGGAAPGAGRCRYAIVTRRGCVAGHLRRLLVGADGRFCVAVAIGKEAGGSGVLGRVVGDAVDPAAPDHPDPGSGPRRGRRGGGRSLGPWPAGRCRWPRGCCGGCCQRRW